MNQLNDPLMQKLLQDLKKTIKRETDKLLCEAHPNICELRDSNYQRLETLLIQEVLSDKYEEAPSVQTVIAELEIELT